MMVPFRGNEFTKWPRFTEAQGDGLIVVGILMHKPVSLELVRLTTKQCPLKQRSAKAFAMTEEAPQPLQLPDRWQELVDASRQVRLNAYAKYSNYQVGASLLGESGTIYTGCNVENASFGLTHCAERTAVCSAVAAGETSFSAVCISLTGHPYPCGSCRQVLVEFNSQMIVLMDNLDLPDGTTPEAIRLSDLLPKAFLLSD